MTDHDDDQYMKPFMINGFNGNLNQSVWYLSENTIVYPAGNSLIVFDKESGTQNFIQASQESKGITAVAVSYTKRLIAFSEAGVENIIHIYNADSLKKIREINLSNDFPKSKYCVSIVISSKNQILALTEPVNQHVILWDLESDRLVHSFSLSNPRITCGFHPMDPSLCCVAGNGGLQSFRISENGFQSLPLVYGDIDPNSLSAYCWLGEDLMLLGTTSGQLVLLNGGKFKAIIPDSPKDGNEITAIIPILNGVLVGSRGSVVRTYLEVDDKSGYYAQESQIVTCDDTTSRGRHSMQHLDTDASHCVITSHAVSQDMRSVILGLSTNMIISLELRQNDSDQESNKTHQTMTVLVDSFRRSLDLNQSTITGMDLSVRKTWAVTCGVDKSVRIWDYRTGSCLMTKFFSTLPYSVAIHPSGHHIVVGFADRLRFMNILYDEMRCVKELPVKGCRDVQFSEGGNLFAAVNGSSVQVFETYTYECIAVLRGHSAKIRGMCWSLGDSQLITCAVDGAIYQWNMLTFDRDAEFIKKGVGFVAVVPRATGKIVYALGDDRMLLEIEMDTGVVTRQIECHANLSEISIDEASNTLLVGTSQPSLPSMIRAFSLPLSGDYQEFWCSGAPITRMQRSRCGVYVVVATEDGCLVTYRAQEPEEEKSHRLTLDEAPAYSDEIFIPKHELIDKEIAIAELKNKVEELMEQNVYQLRLREMDTTEDVRVLREKYKHEIEFQENRIEGLKTKKLDLEEENNKRIRKSRELHTRMVSKVETKYQNKIMAMVEKYQETCHDMEDQIESWKKQRATMVRSNDDFFAKLTSEYEERLGRELELKCNLQSEVDESRKEYNETIRQLEVDVDAEVEQMKNRFESQLNEERESTLRFKGENGIMKKKFAALQKDIENCNDEIETTLRNDKLVRTHIAGLEKDMNFLQSEIRDRDENITGKEKQIFDLKRKNQELEKFKFVLDARIKEIKFQMEPRENEIIQMQEDIKGMDSSLAKLHFKNTEMDASIGMYRAKLDEIQRQTISNRTKIADNERLMNQMTIAIDQSMSLLRDGPGMRRYVTAMFEKFAIDVERDDIPSAELLEEYDRQNQFLDEKVKSIQSRLESDNRKFKAEKQTIVENNSNLLKEIQQISERIRVEKNQKASRERSMHRKAMMIPNGVESPNPPRIAFTGYSADDARVIEEQREEIKHLKEILHRLQEQMTQDRPGSRGRLEPLPQ